MRIQRYEKDLKKWAFENLENITVARVSEQMSKVLMKVMQQSANFQSNCGYTWPLRDSFILKWMKKLAFNIGQRKSYMVNPYEKENVI